MTTILKTVLSSVETNSYAEIYTLAEKTSYINTQNCYGETALIYAAAVGDANAVRQLLDSGSKIDHQDHEGHSAMHWAAAKGHLEVVKLLAGNRSNINIQDNRHKTPLILAVEHGQYATAAYLLSMGTIKVNHRDHTGNTALHWAIYSRSPELTKLLLLNKAQLDTPNNFGSTPLMWAAKHGALELVNLLLDHGADPELYDNLDRNALICAIENNQQPTAETLVTRFYVAGNTQMLNQAAQAAETHGYTGLVNMLLEKVRA